MVNSITRHLQAAGPEALKAATQHPFLEAAGNGSLSSHDLRKWLVQDIHYTRAYVRFIGRLLSRLPLTFHVHDDTGKKDLQHKTLALLIAALTNIEHEMSFFEKVAARYQLDLESEDRGMSHTTRAYVDMLDSVLAADGSLLKGLTVLWATEFSYLTAWTYAKSQSKHVDESLMSEEELNTHAALHRDFIPNWTNREFATFVEQCADVLDDYANYESGICKPAQFKAVFGECEATFRHVVWLEKAFWPGVN